MKGLSVTKKLLSTNINYSMLKPYFEMFLQSKELFATVLKLTKSYNELIFKLLLKKSALKDNTCFPSHCQSSTLKYKSVSKTFKEVAAISTKVTKVDKFTLYDDFVMFLYGFISFISFRHQKYPSRFQIIFSTVFIMQ